MSTTKDITSSVKKHAKEIITPHRLTVAILIRNFCHFRETEVFRNDIDENLKTKYRRDFCILALKLIQSPDLTLEELRNLLISKFYVIHPSVIKNFDDALQELNSTGTGSLLDIIDSVNRLMNASDSTVDATKNYIGKSSVIGYYLRRLIINFDKLTFSEVTAVLQAFKTYYTPMQKVIECSSLNVITNDEINVLQGEDWYTDRHQWSRRQAELFIATQAALLSNNEEKALSPNELQKRIKDLLKSNPDLAEAHYLSYLNYLRVKEYCGAIDSLYHCFDRNALITLERVSDEKSNKGYRFAALNLAVLHFHFGHRNEALAALKEAITISQEANDNVCLQHALSWLYCLNEQKSDKLIEHSIIKSLVLNLFYNMSLGIQSFVQYAGLTTGNPKQIFETLTKSDIINCQHNHQDLVSNSYAQKSSLWLFYGKSEMSSLWSQLLLNLNTDNPRLNRTFYGEGFCQSLCNVANHLLLQGEYNQAQIVLQLARERFPNEPISHTWMLCDNVLTFIHCLHQEKWLEAEAVAQKMFVLNEYESCLRLAELYLYKQDYVEAHHYVSTVLDKVQNKENSGIRVDYRVRAMILLAEIQCASSFPNFVPSNIVTLLNSCFVYAHEYHLDYYSSLIHLHLAHTQFLTGMPAQALKILDRCLVQIFAHAGKFDSARALLLYVKCLVANSKHHNENERKKVVLECMEMLEKAKDHFNKVEAFTRSKDILYLQALLYNEINMNAERNNCAMEYRLQNEEHPSKNNYILLKYL